MTHIRLGTRASKLALYQSELVARLLREAAPGTEVELVEISTSGDRDQSTPLQEGSSAGWFTTAIQQALQRGEIDIAVHSYKDLPTKRPEGLTIAAVPTREDPRDALVSNGNKRLRNLPEGARVGTSSPRRTAQVLAVRPDLRVESIRGNVDTRIAKVRSGDYDAAVLAYAGLKRLEREDEIAQVFGIEEMLPAPAQGALAVECRSADAATLEKVKRIDDRSIRMLVSAERTFLATLEAGCSFPAASYAEHFGSTIKVHGLIANEGRIVRSKMGGPAETSAGLGRALAHELMAAAGLTVEQNQKDT